MISKYFHLYLEALEPDSLGFKQMVIHEDGIRATDFYGRRVFISGNTGQIMKKEIVK